MTEHGELEFEQRLREAYGQGYDEGFTAGRRYEAKRSPVVRARKTRRSNLNAARQALLAAAPGTSLAQALKAVPVAVRDQLRDRAAVTETDGEANA